MPRARPIRRTNDWLRTSHPATFVNRIAVLEAPPCHARKVTTFTDGTMGRKGGMSELLEVVSGLPKATSALWCSASKQHRDPSAAVSKHGYFYYRRSVITHRLRDSPQVSCISGTSKLGVACVG